MMPDDIRTRKAEILRKRLETLWEDYEAAITQTTTIRGRVEQNQVEREAEEIYRKIEELDSELKLLELAPVATAVAISKPDAASLQEKLRSQLHHIDFKELSKTIDIILRDHHEGGCAALLLFQESDTKGGEWCAARIRELLKRVTDEGKFREMPVRFEAREKANSLELLRRIGQHLGIEPNSHDSTSRFSQEIIQTLRRSLQHGSVVMINCQGCDDIFGEIDEFYRILEDFWRKMVSELERVSKQCYEVKIITLLFTGSKPLPDNNPVDYCCTLGQFQKNKLLKLPQEDWTQEDIRVWIARYSVRNDLDPSQIDRMAKRIYESAGGLPHVIGDKLLQECCPL